MSVTQLAVSNVTAVNNIGTSPVQVIGRAPTRTGITFHNPSVNGIVVFPTTVLVPGGVPTPNQPLNPSLTALGGGFFLPYGATLFFTGAVAGQAWQALALLGTNNPLTVMEHS